MSAAVTPPAAMAPRKPHHPPDPGRWRRPTTAKPAAIEGELAIAGYGCRGFFVAVVPHTVARRMIVRRHYSRRFVNNSYVHLGVFIRGRLRGALQLGYMLNPARAGKVVAGTSNTDYLELNRMWLSDAAPRNSESRAISYAFRYIRQAMPHVRWVQSYADERCGAWGVVYQAANFLYLGAHASPFYELDGEVFHQLMVTAHRRSNGPRGRYLRENLHRARRVSFRQFRYVFFLHKGARRHLRMPPQPYPKPGSLIMRSVSRDKRGRPPRQPGSIPGDRSIPPPGDSPSQPI